MKILRMKNVIALCGSTAKNSTNRNLINAIKNLTIEKMSIEFYDELGKLPHFNPDDDQDNPPGLISDFRKLLRSSDGILICTPEYAMGVPGTLKNAIDWTVSSMEFSHRPTALITASSLGQKGHQSLLETLRIIEANLTTETQLIISHAKTKINEAGITDKETEAAVTRLLFSFEKLMDHELK